MTFEPGLSPAFRLAVRRGRGYVERIADRQPVAALCAAEAVAVALMNGRRSWPELEDGLREAAGETGVSFLHSVRSRLAPLLADGARATSAIPLRTLVRVLPPDPSEGLRTLPGPRVLHWCVTRFCPRRCAYCYAEPKLGGSAPDATVPRRDLQSIFQEAASLGARYLLPSGSEPFLREDLPEVLGDAIGCGITPCVTTKHAIRRALAERLAEACVRHISLSIDSMDEEDNLALVGSSAYPSQVRRSVEHLKRAGIAFSIQSVLTALNRNRLDEVADFAEQSGAVIMQVVPFEQVRATIGTLTNASMELAGESIAEESVAWLKRRHPALTVELFEFLGTGSRSGYHCDIGMTKLFFLPDGVVHRCYKLTDDDALRGLDLKKVSVARAWHDPAFYRILYPRREHYRGSDCGRCQHFDSCHADGRCIYSAMVNHGRYAARDRACNGPFSSNPQFSEYGRLPDTPQSCTRDQPGRAEGLVQIACAQ